LTTGPTYRTATRSLTVTILLAVDRAFLEGTPQEDSLVRSAVLQAAPMDSDLHPGQGMACVPVHSAASIMEA
jgi:hypothetical protein